MFCWGNGHIFSGEHRDTRAVPTPQLFGVLPGEPLRNRAVSQHGGYVIINHKEAYGLDSFQDTARHQCFASMANSPYKYKNLVRGTFPEANILPFTEILVNYGATYLYPTQYDK